ncbi:hypothetical protein ACOMHN_031860 [Nucella lapillus]
MHTVPRSIHSSLTPKALHQQNPCVYTTLSLLSNIHYSSTAQRTTLQPSISQYCLRVPKTQLPRFPRTEHLSTSPHTQGKRPAHTTHTRKTTCTYNTNLSLRRENTSAKNAVAKLPPPEDW